MNKQLIRLLFLLSAVGGSFGLLAATNGTAQAATGAPKAFAFQGRLYDSSNNLLGGAGTSYCFRFSIYDTPTTGAGVKLWPATVPGSAQLTVKNGVFSANVGIDTPDALTFDYNSTDTSYLQTEVATFSGSCGTFEALNPRQRIVASGYALNANTVGGASTGTAANNVLKLDASGNIGLSATNPQISASGTNTLTLQNAATGNLQFFSASNTLSSSGNLTLAGSFSSAATSNQIVLQSAGVSGTLSWTPTTANKTITLPDATGTVCLQGSVSCGFTSSTGTVSLAPVAAQTDASTNASININKTASTGLIINHTRTFTATAPDSSTDGAYVRTVTGGANALNGTILSLTDNSTTSAAYATTGISIIQNTAAANSLYTGNFINFQRADVAGAAAVSKFSVSGLGNVTTAGTLNTDTLTGSALTFGTAAATSIQSAAGQSITLDSGTTGAVGIGTGASVKTITIGNVTGASNIVIKAGTGGISNGDDAIAKTISIGSVSTTANDNINIATNASSLNTIAIGSGFSTSKLTLNAGINGITSGVGVVVGSATADANQVNFELDTSSTFTETASTCSTTLNQGSLYYNSASGAIRSCVNGGWEDVVTTAGLGIMLFGVVPDSGTNPGDLASVVTPGASGPCKVSLASTTTINISACIAYSGGRKVTVAAQSAVAIALSATNIWQHICLSGAAGVPAPSTAAATENANLLTLSLVSPGAPILCLADIKTSGTAITALYDTRTFTTTQKQFATVATTGPSLGNLTVGTATAGNSTLTSTTAGIGKLQGVVVASTGSSATNTINAIIATAGPGWAKAVTTGTINDYIENSTTAGYAITVAAAPAPLYSVLGLAQTALTTTCTLASNCASSLFTNINLR